MKKEEKQGTKNAKQKTITNDSPSTPCVGTAVERQSMGIRTGNITGNFDTNCREYVSAGVGILHKQPSTTPLPIRD